MTRKRTNRRSSVLLVGVLGFLVAAATTVVTNVLFFGDDVATVLSRKESPLYTSTSSPVMYSVTGDINERIVEGHRMPEKKKSVTKGNTKQDGSEEDSDKNCIYSKQRPDRSGAVIVDMMAAHAFAHRHDKRYCGACGESAHQDQTKALIRVLGLQTELPLQCPVTDDASSSIQPKLYDRNFTDEWRLYMKDRIHRSSSSEPGPHKVVVHVRRDDVKPGTYAFYGKDMYDRYLPNSYYLDLIEKYKQPDSQVLIFSEEASSSSLEEFAARGNYQLHTNESAEEAWRHFLDCDVLITSRSEFSYAPALFTRASTVVSPKFWVPALSNWVVVTNPTTR